MTIAVVMILKVVFAFVEKMRNGKKGDDGPKGFNQTDRNLLYEAHRQVGEVHADREKIRKLYDWHNRQDADGTPVWYVKASFGDNVEKLSEAIAQLTRSGDANTHLLETLCAELRRRAPTEDGQ